MNPRAWQLLRLLSDGEFHSGEMLAKQLGVSRATVFNDLASVAGVQLQRIRGRGYRLAGGWQPLDKNEIERCLGSAADRFRIEVMQQAASSNTELLRRVNMPGGTVLAVELQTAGKGRIGRAWHSGLGNALTFSLLWRFDCGLNALSGLSLAVGVAIFRALRLYSAAGVGLKWPNDILTSRGKLGGVLIEVQGDMYGPSHAVIGIGINLSLPVKIAQSIGQPAISLDQVCTLPPERNHLMAALLEELAAVLDVFAEHGFSALRIEWERCHAQQDLLIRLQMPDGKTVAGIARGVSDNGELMLETEQGIRRYNSGEVGA
jgi:BirA family transcriptional regulator, biotin operon repressor / biotin---[acetyl-CoA-carboxylase] ligase